MLMEHSSKAFTDSFPLWINVTAKEKKRDQPVLLQSKSSVYGTTEDDSFDIIKKFIILPSRINESSACREIFIISVLLFS